MNGDDANADPTLGHARDGYAQVQEVIRFVDTKAGVLLGLVVLVTLVPVHAVQWIAGDAERLKACIELSRVWLFSAWGIFGLSVAGLVLGEASLWMAMECVAPRGRGPAKASVLFPVTTDAKELANIGRKLKRGMTAGDILGEYEDQLKRSGMILAIKMRRLGWAAFCFKMQMAAYVGASIWALLVYTLSEHPSKAVSPSAATSAPLVAAREPVSPPAPNPADPRDSVGTVPGKVAP